MPVVKTWDVIIVGGGIIGISLAIALRRRGATVLIVERGEPGHEASRAAGGMLVDCPVETPAALQPLASASALMYPTFVRELELESGLKADLRDQGTILFTGGGHAQQLRQAALTSQALVALEPAIANAPAFSLPAFFLKERSVDPRALVAAAWGAAKKLEVDFSSGDAVTAINLSDTGVSGVTTTKTTFLTSKVVNSAGAWSGKIGPYPLPTRPVKGQMLCLTMPFPAPLKHVVRTPDVYLIPRSDGRLLVGATVEEVGFDKRVDLATIQRLHRAALTLVPKLAEARILEDWAGLRPGTPDALPILGATPTPGYYVATGHFRDGILLAPVTAEVMTAVIEDRSPEFDLSSFRPTRFAR